MAYTTSFIRQELVTFWWYRNIQPWTILKYQTLAHV
ncbi:unnamed protein product [Ixodes persulcatus]